MKTVISNNGVPLAVYADRHTIFRSPKTDKLSLEDQLNGKEVRATQFGRALAELGSNLIWAKTALGKYLNGGFISIPAFGIGCDLAGYSDYFWNNEHLARLMNPVDAATVAEALRTLIRNKYI